jgi:hypothetical protein
MRAKISIHEKFQEGLIFKDQLVISMGTYISTHMLILNMLVFLFFNFYEDYFLLGLFNKCKIAHVKVTKNSNYLLKNPNYILKNYTFNKKCTSSHTNLLF